MQITRYLDVDSEFWLTMNLPGFRQLEEYDASRLWANATRGSGRVNRWCESPVGASNNFGNLRKFEVRAFGNGNT